MGLFEYTGQLESGAAFEGTLEAPSTADAQQQLADMRVRVLALRPAKRLLLSPPLSQHDLTLFNEQLSALTRAGVPLEQGLRELAAETGSRRLKRLLRTIAADLAAGASLPEALERHRSRLPSDYAAVVRAGVATGDLPGTLHGLTAHLRLVDNFRRALVEAAVYPLVTLAAALLILTVVMRQVVPNVLVVLYDYGDTYVYSWMAARPAAFAWTPVPVLEAVVRFWPLIEAVALGLVAVVVVGLLVLQLPPLRAAREHVLRCIPLVRTVYRASCLARFTHAASLAAYTGRPLSELLADSAGASGSPALQRAVAAAAEPLVAGASLSDAFGNQTAVPPLWISTVTVAAPRGDLSAALAELARYYEEQARLAAATLRMVVGPLLMLGVGLVLAMLLVVLLMPIQGFLRALY